MYHGENLLEVSGSTPPKYARNLMGAIYRDRANEYVLTNNGRQPHNTRHRPVPLTTTNIIKNVFFLF